MHKHKINIIRPLSDGKCNLSEYNEAQSNTQNKFDLVNHLISQFS